MPGQNSKFKATTTGLTRQARLSATSGCANGSPNHSPADVTAAHTKPTPQQTAGARSAQAKNLPATSHIGASNGEPRKEDRRTISQKTEDAYERGYGAKSKGPDDKETIEARAEFRQLQDQEFKEASAEMSQGIDGLRKAFGQMLTPAGGASSGAVAGSTLRSSV